jgi:hypothetical protein
MPVVGIVDIALGIVLLVYPVRIAALWLIFWGLFTASLRPLSGEHFAEFLERAGNYGAPLMLLLLSGAQSPAVKYWFKKIQLPGPLDEQRLSTLMKPMQVIAFLLLAGHGWLNLIGKTGLIKQYEMLGFPDAHLVATLAGSLEVLGALLILIKPMRQIVLIFFLWKMTSELFYPTYEFFEWVERGGSYAILLGLWLAMKSYIPQSKSNLANKMSPSV